MSAGQAARAAGRSSPTATSSGSRPSLWLITLRACAASIRSTSASARSSRRPRGCDPSTPASSSAWQVGPVEEGNQPRPQRLGVGAPAAVARRVGQPDERHTLLRSALQRGHVDLARQDPLDHVVLDRCHRAHQDMQAHIRPQVDVPRQGEDGQVTTEHHATGDVNARPGLTRAALQRHQGCRLVLLVRHQAPRSAIRSSATGPLIVTSESSNHKAP
jgi:hypothetical protein